MQNNTDSSHIPTNPPRLFADQVAKQFDHTIFGTSATLINSLLLAFILRAHVQHAYLIVWLGCAGVVSACRLILNERYQKSPTRQSQPQKWNIRFNVTLFLAGILWGSSAIFMFSSDSIGHQAFIAFVAGGMVAGAVSSFTAILTAFFIFSIPALLPICISFIMLGDEMHIAMGVMSFLFLFIMCLTAVRIHRNILHLLSLKYERNALITNLQAEIDQRKKAENDLHLQKNRVEEMVTQRTAQLKSANQRLRAVLNYAPLAIWAFNRKGMLTFADGKSLEKMGFVRNRCIGKSIFDQFAENKPFVDISQRVLKSEFISDTIFFDKVSFEVRYQPMVDETLHLSGAIGVAIDVTEQTAAKEALRKSKEQYQELVENINDTLYATDRKGIITYVSPVIESVLGYRTDELIGQNLFNFIHNKDAPRLKKDFIKARDAVSPQRDYRFVEKSGAPKWCRVSSRPISNDHKNIGIQGVLVDIDWSKRLEEQLHRAQKMEALGTLAGGVAHDLNNILSGIISIPELIMMDLPDDPRMRRLLTIIKKSGENASAVVQDLLTLARRGVPVHECLNVNDVINQCLESPDLGSLLRLHPNITLKKRLQSDLFNIYGSSIHIFKSVTNLISNAVEAMPGGGCIEIETNNRYTDGTVSGFDTVKEGEYVVLSISDSGIGIDEKDQSKIFEPFYTNKIMGRSGSGLGMAVVWGTVKDHKGYIDIHSAPGQGTKFELFFPATRDQLPQKQPLDELSNFKGNGELIVVVDDMPTQREIATRILNRLGYRTKSVTSGEEAVAFFKDSTAELLILDMIMDPGIDGYETYRQIKKIRPDQKAIIASGYSETARVRKTLKMGAGKYIKKPYTMAIIGQAVKHELEKY